MPSTAIRRPSWKEWLFAALASLALGILLHLFVIQGFRISSNSMAPTLLPGDMLLVSKLAYGQQIGPWRLPAMAEPEPGDLVVFAGTEKSTSSSMIVKRVVAGSGDTIAMREGVLIRNSLPMPEKYLSGFESDVSTDSVMVLRMRRWQSHPLIQRPESNSPILPATVKDWGPILVPEGSVLVMGDNRSESYDSRFWGFLPTSRLRGSPIIIYFSYNRELKNIRWRRIGRTPK